MRSSTARRWNSYRKGIDLKCLLAIVFILSAPSASPQDTTRFELRSRLNGTFTLFDVDNLGNIYAVTPENRLKKYNPRGDSMGVFNDVRRYGRLTAVDASNPLKTLLFYRDFRTVVVLDRFLNLVNVVDLRKQDLFQVGLVAQSYDNRIWLFDEQESRLRKIDEDGRPSSETAELRMVLDEAPEPVTLQDRNGYVFMYDPLRGMYVFDYYGAMKGRMLIPGWQDVRVVGDIIMGRKDGMLMSQKTGMPEPRAVPMPAQLNRASRLVFSTSGIYALDESGIGLYAPPPGR